MIPLATAGSRPLAFVDAAGYIHRDDHRLEWWVLGDDCWHAPRATASLRQQAVEGTPVIETTIRVPGGDVVWRVGASVAGVVVECENRAAIPIALGLARVGTGDEVRELEVFPVTHGTTWRRALDDYNDRDVPELASVVRGWHALARQGASVQTGDPTIDDALAAARLAVLLHHGAVNKRHRHAGASLNNALVYLGYDDEASDLRVACKLKPQRKGLALVARDTPPAPVAAEALALLADADLAGRVVEAIRNRLVGEAGSALDVLPGFGDDWRGRSVDIANLPTAHGPLSFAVRWHGEKPALLWDAPAPITASAIDPTFSSSEPSGEKLLG